MKTITIILITCLALIAATKLYANLTKKKVVTNTTTTQNETETITQFHDLSYTTLLGDSIPLSTYKGKVLLIVNTASHCGFTTNTHIYKNYMKHFKTKTLKLLAFLVINLGTKNLAVMKILNNFVTYVTKLPFQCQKKLMLLVKIKTLSTHF